MRLCPQDKSLTCPGHRCPVAGGVGLEICRFSLLISVRRTSTLYADRSSPGCGGLK